MIMKNFDKIVIAIQYVNDDSSLKDFLIITFTQLSLYFLLQITNFVQVKAK